MESFFSKFGRQNPHECEYKLLVDEEEVWPDNQNEDDGIYYASILIDGKLLIGEANTNGFKQYIERKDVEERIQSLNFKEMGSDRIMSDTTPNSYDLFYFKKGQRLFVIATHKVFPKRISENCLRDMATKLESKKGAEDIKAIDKMIKNCLEKHNDKENDTYCRSQRKVREAAREAKETMNKIFKRGKNMDSIIDQTSMIVNDTYKGKSQSKKLKWEKRCGSTCAIVTAFLIAFIFIVVTMSLLLFRIGTWGDPRDYLGIKHDPNDKTIIEKGKDYLHRGEDYIQHKWSNAKQYIYPGKDVPKTPETTNSDNNIVQNPVQSNEPLEGATTQQNKHYHVNHDYRPNNDYYYYY